MAEIAKQEGVVNEVGVNDELGKQIKEKQIAEWEFELENFENNLEKLRTGRERFQRMWARDERLYELMVENLKKVEGKADMAYELLDEYWELKKDQLNDKYLQDKHLSESKLQEFDMNEETILEEMESIRESLEKAKKEL